MLLPKNNVGFERALPALERQLTLRGFDVVAIEAHAAPYVLPAPKTGQKTLAIAVGAEAEDVAAGLGVPTVFCQIAPVDVAPDEDTPNLHGVPALPPLSLQLRAWRQLSPGLARVAMILGPGRDATAAEARRVAKAESVSLILRTASSDQEALYLFKRLAPEVDGLWLVPDNTVLSPRVIKAMLDQAARHKVQTLVFTPTLLEWGGLASVSSTPGNLAWTLAEVVSRLASEPADVPALTPLSEAELDVNEGEAVKLGLHPPARSWIVRDEAW
ncbi:MAG TPA: ABC transporter substrate binding protein [Gammaproteobacteria bacterium]|nr:ABC transporter substrate binding protein [Gammaproteobacteria bacterium]